MVKNGVITDGSKPFVVAVPIPWSVSTNVANLSMSWREDGESVIRCDAFFGRHHLGAVYKRVAVRFTGCVSLIMEARVSDNQVIGGDRYDWNGVRRPRPKTEDELTAWLTAYADDWASTGNCPNPHIYRVERSTWAASFRHDYQHFIIEGTDSFAELLAHDFTWEVESDLAE